MERSEKKLKEIRSNAKKWEGIRRKRKNGKKWEEKEKRMRRN